MKLTWLTDVHLNFLEKDKRMDFYQTLIATDGSVAILKRKQYSLKCEA